MANDNKGKEVFDIGPVGEEYSVDSSYALTPMSVSTNENLEVLPLISQNDFNEDLNLPLVTNFEDTPIYELTVPTDDFNPSDMGIAPPASSVETPTESIPLASPDNGSFGDANLSIESTDSQFEETITGFQSVNILQGQEEDSPIVEPDPLSFTFNTNFSAPTIAPETLGSLEPPKVEKEFHGEDFFKLLGSGIYDVVTFNKDEEYAELSQEDSMDKLRGGISKILSNEPEDPFDTQSTASKLIQFDKSKEEIRSDNSWFWDKPSVDKGFERTERLLSGVNEYEKFYNPDPPEITDWSDLGDWDGFWSTYLEGHLSTALDDAKDIVQKDIIGNLFHNPLSRKKGGDGSIEDIGAFEAPSAEALGRADLEELGTIPTITLETEEIQTPATETSEEESEEETLEGAPAIPEETFSEEDALPALENPARGNLLDGPKANDNYSGLAGADDFGGTFGFVSYVGTGTKPRQSQEPIFQNGNKKYYAKDDTPLFSQMITNVDFLFPYQYNMFIIGNDEENPFETVRSLQNVQVDGVTLDNPINYKLKGFGVPALKRNSQNITYGHMSQRVALTDRAIEYKSEIEVMSNRDLQNFLKFCKLAGVGVYQKLLNLSLNLEDSFNIASTNNSQRVDLNVVSSYDYQEEGNNVYLTLLKPSYINNESLYGGSVDRVGVNGVSNWTPESALNTCFKFYNFRVISIKDMSFSFNNSRENDNPFTFKAVVAWSRMEQLQIS